MCNPAIILGVMSAAASMAQAKAASDAQDAAYDENVRASAQAKKDADRQINLQQSQAQEAAATEQLQNDLQTQELVARAVVAGGESGAEGGSITAVQENIVRQGLIANAMLTQNLGREIAQLRESRLGVRSQHTSRINAVSQGGGVGVGQVLGAVSSGVQTGLSVAGSMKSLSLNKGGGAGGTGNAPIIDKSTTRIYT